MKLDLSSPCPQCPFRTDIDGYLTSGRVREIAISLYEGNSFPCHKTTVDDGEGDLVATSNSQQCAGAEIWLAHQGLSTKWRGVAAALGANVSVLDMDAPVARSLADLKRVHGFDLMEVETCSTVGPNCSAPAGYLMGGGSVPGEDAAEFTCFQCGEPVCGECSAVGEYDSYGVQRRCLDCREEEWL